MRATGPFGVFFSFSYSETLEFAVLFKHPFLGIYKYVTFAVGEIDVYVTRRSFVLINEIYSVFYDCSAVCSEAPTFFFIVPALEFRIKEVSSHRVESAIIDLAHVFILIFSLPVFYVACKTDVGALPVAPVEVYNVLHSIYSH